MAASTCRLFFCPEQARRHARHGHGDRQEPRHRSLVARQAVLADSLPESRHVRVAPRVRAARRLSRRCRRPVRQVDQGQGGGAETVNGQGDGFRPPACRCLQLRRRMARSAGRRHARRPVGCRGARREPQDQGPRRAHVPLLRGTAQGGEAGVRTDRHTDAAQSARHLCTVQGDRRQGVRAQLLAVPPVLRHHGRLRRQTGGRLQGCGTRCAPSS